MALISPERWRAAVAGPQRAMRGIEVALLVVLGLVLLQCVFLLYSYVTSAEVDSVLPAADSLDIVGRREPVAVTTDESFEMQARPVFWASRRPLDPLPEAFAETSAESGRPARALKNLSVTGILANGENSRVLVTLEGKQQRLAPGDDIDGWTLVEVMPDAVVFASAGARDERRLTPAPVVPDTPAAAGADQPRAPKKDNTEQGQRLSLGG